MVAANRRPRYAIVGVVILEILRVQRFEGWQRFEVGERLRILFFDPGERLLTLDVLQPEIRIRVRGDGGLHRVGGGVVLGAAGGQEQGQGGEQQFQRGMSHA